MKKSLIILGLALALFSCGESEEQLKIEQEQVKEEMEETSVDLFDSLEEDLNKEEEEEFN